MEPGAASHPELRPTLQLDELVAELQSRLQAVQVRQEKLFGEIAVRKHTHFEQIMNERAAVRDDWR